MKFQSYCIGFFVGVLLLNRLQVAQAAESSFHVLSLANSVSENASAITFEPLTMPKDTYTLDAELIFHKVNDYRIQRGLPPLEWSEEIYKIARSRESQLWGEITSGQIHAGFKSLHLPYFATENMKYGFSEDDVVSWWLKSPIHHASIVGNYKYSSVTCKGHVCIQLFTNHSPKQN